MLFGTVNIYVSVKRSIITRSRSFYWIRSVFIEFDDFSKHSNDNNGLDAIGQRNEVDCLGRSFSKCSPYVPFLNVAHNANTDAVEIMLTESGCDWNQVGNK